MRDEAQTHAEQDLQRKELAEAKNIADQGVYTGEKLLHDHGDTISAELKSDLENKINDVKTRLGAEDGRALKTAAEALLSVIEKVGTDIHQPSGEPMADASPNPDEDVIEGEFKEEE
jgi:molecular chaperone DnaK